MVKFAIVLLIAAAVIANTEALRQRTSSRLTARSNSRRVLARQEAADEAPITPYPSADELKPEVPFDEAAADLPAVAEETPEVTLYNVPDEVYGPPEQSEVTTVEPAAEQFPGPLNAEEAQLLAEFRSAKLRQRQAAYRRAVVAKRRSAKLQSARKTVSKKINKA